MLEKGSVLAVEVSEQVEGQELVLAQEGVEVGQALVLAREPGEELAVVEPVLGRAVVEVSLRRPAWQAFGLLLHLYEEKYFPPCRTRPP